MRIPSHRWRGWVLLVALVAGCGSGETKAEHQPGQLNDSSKATRAPEEGGRQQARELLQPPVEPQDWPRLFTERINAGDLDGAAALYEPDARFVTPSGETRFCRKFSLEGCSAMLFSWLRWLPVALCE